MIEKTDRTVTPRTYGQAPDAATDQAVSERRGVVAVVASEGRLLVIRRSQHVVAPAAYCFPGGGIEPGETVEAALVREMQEELGVVCRPRRSLWASRTQRGVWLAWWEVELAPGSVLAPNPAEVESFAWHTPYDIRELPGLLASNVDFLDALARGDFILAGLQARPGVD
jgi:8-oxo-dGTP diphosphatase